MISNPKVNEDVKNEAVILCIALLLGGNRDV